MVLSIVQGVPVPCYRIAGLAVSSDIELPGFPQGPPGAADVVIARAAVPPALPDADASGPTWALRPGRFLLAVPGVARYLLRDGAAIDYEPAADAEPGDLAAFTLGAAFGVLLHQRGLVVLHASSVCVNGKAALFLGPSGAGKSTLAAALVRRGYPLVADDFCVISVGPAGQPLAHPDGSLPKLWTEAIEELDLGERRVQPVRGRLQKFYMERSLGGVSEAPLPLGPAFVLREARAPHRPGIQRPNIVDAARLVRANAYRPGVVRKMGQEALYFLAAAAIGNGDGVFYLTRALDFAAMDAVIEGLEAHWGLADARAAVA
jgi:hypothetical protein